jgi:hypothetical protein
MKLKLAMSCSRVAGTALLALFSAASHGADYATTVLAEGPLAYWRFNETTTSPALNQVANLGSLGGVANGNLILEVGKGEPGMVGKAVRFLNEGNVVGYCGTKIDVPFHPALNPRGPFSFEFWAKPNLLGGDATGSALACSMNPNFFTGGNRSGWLLYMNNAGRWQFRMGTPGGYAGTCTATKGNAVVGQWQHMVITWDGASMAIYANGEQIGSLTLDATAIASWEPNTQTALRMGGTTLHGELGDGPAITASGMAGNRGYDGWLDEVALYGKALGAATIAAHHAAATTNAAGYGAQILADGPIGYWNMDEPAYPAPDSSALPVAVNAGSVGADGNGTNLWGVLAAQDALPYAGFGPNNKACLFDGTSGYVSLGNPQSLNFSGNITMMAWIKPGVKDFFRNILAHGWQGDYQEVFLRLSRGEGASNYGDGNYYELGVTDNVYYDAAYFPIPEGDINNWVFLAGTYDGSFWRLYRNGNEVASLESPNGALTITNRWSIGSRSDANENMAEGHFFGGYMDEPAIFNKALSAAKIKEIYLAAQASPVISQAPSAPATMFKGDPLALSVWAEGSPTLSYLWLSNGIFLGVTTTNLNLASLDKGLSEFAVVVTNAYGAVTSSVSINVVAAPPVIVKNPAPVWRFEGLPFVFSVSASGSAPLTYQWRANGVDIPGANGPTYSGTASADKAANYSVKITNEAGEAISAEAALTVVNAPKGYGASVLASSPTAYWRLGETSGNVAVDYVGSHNGTYFNALLNQTGYSSLDADKAVSFGGNNSYVGGISGTEINFAGTNASFTLECWVKGAPGQPDESTVIAKGAGSSGTTAGEQFALDVSGGLYRFFVRGGNNSLDYAAVASAGPNGTWQHVVGVYDSADPASPAMHIYVNGALSGSASGRPAGPLPSSAPVSIGSKRLGNDPNYDGSFNGTIDEVAIYPTALAENAIAAHYSDAFGTTLAPRISLPPKAATNYLGLPATFSVSAEGSMPLTYQWKKNGQDIAGATAFNYTINSLTAADAGDYTVTISNTIGTTNSAPATLAVLSAPTKIAIPGLVLHLPFNGNLTDSTGRGNNGTSIQMTATSSNVAPATYVAGKLGQALHYESQMGAVPAGGATDTNNLYVTLGVRPDLQFSSNVNFTIAYWIRLPLNYVGGDLPFFTTAVGSTFSAGIVLAPSYGDGGTSSTGESPGGWAMSLYDLSDNGAGHYGEISSINDNNWHHLVHVVERGVGSVTYLNGRVAVYTREGGTHMGAAVDIDTGNAATIGQDPTGTYAETGSGDMDDLGIWRRALTPLEAASLYVGGMNGVSFEYVPPAEISLAIEKADGNAVKITWVGGTLQSSDNVAGPYTNMTGANSPLTVTPGSGGATFYRVKQ